MKFAVPLIVAIVVATAFPIRAQEFCGWRPRDIADPTDIRGTTLTLSTARDTFGIYNDCVTIIRRQFGSSLNFGLVNRFSPDVGIKSGYVLIKSIRMLSNSPPIKVSLSRGGGWTIFEKDDGPPKPARLMYFEPYRGTIDSWNAAYANPGSPSEFATRLHTPWHAYADIERTVASSDFADFWKVEGTFDQVHGVITNYLIHFDINTDPKVSLIPFSVFLQPEVQQFELRILSGPESLSGTYKFVVK